MHFHRCFPIFFLKKRQTIPSTKRASGADGYPTLTAWQTFLVKLLMACSFVVCAEEGDLILFGVGCRFPPKEELFGLWRAREWQTASSQNINIKEQTMQNKFTRTHYTYVSCCLEGTTLQCLWNYESVWKNSAYRVSAVVVFFDAMVEDRFGEDTPWLLSACLATLWHTTRTRSREKQS